MLREFGFDDIFEVVVESAVVGVRKPDPAIYRLALEQLALDNLTEVTVVGDSMKNDIVPAHTLGLKTILIKGEQWDSAYATDIRPDKVISRLDEIE